MLSHDAAIPAWIKACLLVIHALICQLSAAGVDVAAPATIESELVKKLTEGVLGPDGGNRFFYFPTKDEPATPATWGFRFEDLRVKSADGTELHGWFIPSRGKRALGTVVFSHGNAGSLGHHLGFVLWLVESGYHVLAFDYRGFGKSGGEPERSGMVADVQSMFGYIKTRADVDPQRLISYGHSLGGAKSVAALATKRVGGLRAVVVDGAFASYRAMARRMAGQLGEELVTDDLAPVNLVAKLSPTPLLIVHGTADEVVPFSQGRALYEAAEKPKTLFEVKGGGHGNSLSRNQGAYRKRMLVWLNEQLD
jgi:hypothetical protein